MPETRTISVSESVPGDVAMFLRETVPAGHLRGNSIAAYYRGAASLRAAYDAAPPPTGRVEVDRDTLRASLQYAVNWLDDIKGHAALPSMVRVALDRIAEDTGIRPQVGP